MLASEIRANARRALQGKWGKGALIVLCFALISWVISFVLAFIPVIGPIAELVISIPITYGLVVSLIKLKRGEEVKYTGFLEEGFAKFGKVWGVYGHTILKLIVPIILIIVAYALLIFSITGAFVSGFALEDSASYGSALTFSGLTIVAMILLLVATIYGTIKGLLYILANYILYDNPDMTSKEIVEESQRLMNGNRGRLVWLELTFIGWIILCGFTFGIGLLWLLPYMEVAAVCFYEDLAGKTSKEEVEHVEENNPISE